MNDEHRPIDPGEVERLRRTLAEKERELQEVRVRNLFLTTVFNGISEEIMVIDREFNVMDVNRVMMERYGLSKEAVLGRKCFELKEHAGAPCHMGRAGCPLARARGDRGPRGDPLSVSGFRGAGVANSP